MKKLIYIFLILLLATSASAKVYYGITNKVYKTDANGVVGWRDDATSTGGDPFPVGSVFIAVVDTNPATLLGYGTWSAIGAGKVLVGLDSGDVDFDTAEETGGAKTVTSTGTVSQPTFTGDALGTHFHGAGTYAAATATGASKRGTTADTLTQSHGHTISGSSESKTAGTPAGTVSQPTYTGNATSVVQPYLVCYFWKRTE